MTPEQYGLTKAAYSIREAAQVLSIGRTGIYELVRAGKLHPFKPGKKNLILAVEMAALLDEWRNAPAKEHAVKRRQMAMLKQKAQEQRRPVAEATLKALGL